MGLPLSADMSSEDGAVVGAGEECSPTQSRRCATSAGRGSAGPFLGAYRVFHQADRARARQQHRGDRRPAEVAKAAGVDLVLEIVNRFEVEPAEHHGAGPRLYRGDRQRPRPPAPRHLPHRCRGGESGGVDRLPAPGIRLRHIGGSNRGYLGDGVIDFDPIFDALLDIGYASDITFESFSGAVVDDALTLACAIWRDTWTENKPLARHAKAFIDLKRDEARRRRATNARP